MEDGGWSKEDVSFVTLAKAGGRKDLLQHIEYSRPDGQEPVSYPVVDWFAHASPSHSCSPPPPTLPPSLLDWPSSLVEEVPEKKRRRKRDQALRPHKKSSEKTPIKLPKAEPAVNMMQLLAMDYQKEWLKEREQKALEKQRLVKERRETQRRKLEEHTMRARRVCGVEPAERQAEKPRFIMKRFANVPSRVQLPPLTTTATRALPEPQNY